MRSRRCNSWATAATPTPTRGTAPVYGQAWLRIFTNHSRRMWMDFVAGAVRDTVVRPFAQAEMHWQLSPTFALQPSLLYSGTEYYYDVLAHYQNFYRETNTARAALLAIWEAGYDWKVFANLSIDHNDRFTMGGMTVGAYFVL